MSYSTPNEKACSTDAAKTSQTARLSQPSHLSNVFECPNQYFDTYQKCKGLQGNLPAAIRFVSNKDGGNGAHGLAQLSRTIADFENKPNKEHCLRLEAIYSSIIDFFNHLDFVFV